ncbi:MAG: AAA family ATPase [Candidatus Accumulibacter sp.]|jgi:predicted kinase|nr:AAA family ATPase [Accumulibacter sp.]
MELVIFVGIQATGKSSFWRERFSDSHLRINLDMLRTRHRERLIFEACLASKTSLVVDNTNLTRQDRARYIPPARAARFAVHGYFFDSRLEDALRRNAGRSGKARVPDVAVAGALARLQAPAPGEGFDTLNLVRIGPDGAFVTSPWPLAPEGEPS